MKSEDLDRLVGLGHEQRGTEFKGPGLLADKHLLARVAKAALAMTNKREGGLVVVGVEEDSQGPIIRGLSATDLATWKYDDVAAALDPYADPNIAFELEVVNHSQGDVVVLRIFEFEDIPVLCARDYPGVLRRGACYVRSRHKPETTEIPGQEEMRDLLDLATEKRLRTHIAMNERIGFELKQRVSALDRFDEQLGELK